MSDTWHWNVALPGAIMSLSLQDHDWLQKFVNKIEKFEKVGAVLDYALLWFKNTDSIVLLQWHLKPANCISNK